MFFKTLFPLTQLIVQAEFCNIVFVRLFRSTQDERTFSDSDPHTYFHVLVYFVSVFCIQVAAALQVGAYVGELRRRVLASPAVRAELDALRAIAVAFDASLAQLEASHDGIRQLRYCL